jgi:CheY-like chemotaxis protein
MNELNTLRSVCFPTRIAFIDDNHFFLESIRHAIGHLFPLDLYSSPIDAISALQADQRKPFFSNFSPSSDEQLTRSYSNPACIAKHPFYYEGLRDRNHLKRVTVIIADYDMPELNGLELCRTLSKSGIRKILLTGAADDKIAIDAFNKKEIDQFIRKRDEDLISQIISAVEMLQAEYFRENDHLLRLTPPSADESFLHDPDFVKLIQNISKESAIVEHYVVDEPDGVWLFDASGKSYLLLFFTDQQLRDQYDVAHDLGAPTELLTALESRRFVPYFWRTQGYYSNNWPDWRTSLYPASEVVGEKRYTYTLIENPQAIFSRLALVQSECSRGSAAPSGETLVA